MQINGLLNLPPDFTSVFAGYGLTALTMGCIKNTSSINKRDVLSFSVIDSLKKAFLVKPHPVGMPFIIGGLLATLLLLMFSDELALVGLVFTLFCVFFFRDPQRVTPQKASLVIAPADGIVSGITSGPEPAC